jgi:outer membrane lipoprotein-sorting protein
MLKKFLVITVIFALLGVGVWKVFFSGTTISETIENVNSNLSSYQLEATMELNNGEEQRKFAVSVSYMKKDEDDLFRVSLYDTTINQEQIMLRNEEGVYVLTPTLNQVYQFKSGWPLNSAKPYIYQSLLEVFDGEYTTQKMSDGLIVTSEPSYKNAPQYVKQEIKFTNDLKPVWVHLYNENNDVLVNVTFTKVEVGVGFEEEYFNLSKNMESARENLSSTTGATFDDLPLNVTGLDMNVSVKEQTNANIDGDKTYIMSYDGDVSFTVVQKIVGDSEEMSITEIDGELILLVNGFASIEDNKVTYLYNGVECTIYGNNLQVSTYIDIANGLEVVGIK